MEIKKLDVSILNELLNLFIDVYNNPPWNDQWVVERAKVYLMAFMADPSFIGYSAYHNRQLIGACFGTIKHWWKGDEYYIHEIFIDRSSQRQGIGSSFIDNIQKDLQQKDIRTISLLTDKGTPADKFYNSNGFKDINKMVFKYKTF